MFVIDNQITKLKFDLMRKVILSMMVSVDGFIEGVNSDINWHVWDEEMSDYMMGVFDTVDTFLYGRVAYELMISYWPDAETTLDSRPQDILFAHRMNTFPKIVFSKTLKKVEWNSRLVKESIGEEISKLKSIPGKDLILYGGADLASTFMDLNLIDEYRLIVNPVVLGSGIPLFKGLKKPLNLKLVRSQSFKCGNVILYYQPEKE
jgi:dihydrofolate reductase